MDTAYEVAADPSALVSAADHLAQLFDLFDASQMSVGAVLAVISLLTVRRVANRSRSANTRKK